MLGCLKFKQDSRGFREIWESSLENFGVAGERWAQRWRSMLRWCLGVFARIPEAFALDAAPIGDVKLMLRCVKLDVKVQCLGVLSSALQAAPMLETGLNITLTFSLTRYLSSGYIYPLRGIYTRQLLGFFGACGRGLERARWYRRAPNRKTRKLDLRYPAEVELCFLK